MKLEKIRFKVWLFITVFLFAIFSSFLIATIADKYNSDKSLSLLAGQFLKGHLSLEPNHDLPTGDIAKYGGKYYMYFGPLGSIILVPFVGLLGLEFPQITIGIGTLLVSFIAIYIISRSFKFEKIDSLWLSLFFVFSTVLLSTSLINITSYLVEALGVPLILLSLMFYFQKKKRPLLIGIFLGLAILTRVTLILAVVFFVYEFFKKRLTRKQFIMILIPVIFACIFLGVYNFLRFDSFLQTGYIHHIGDPYPLSENKKFGWTNPMHLPANLYAFFIKPPEPLLYAKDGFVFKFPYFKADPWGMAIWFTSPLFLMLLFNFRKNKYFNSLLTTTLVIAFPIFIYYSVGFAQFGYRYALDFLPFLFLLLIPCLSPSGPEASPGRRPKLSKIALTLIIMGVIFNCVYITSLWDVYPHFGIYK